MSTSATLEHTKSDNPKASTPRCSSTFTIHLTVFLFVSGIKVLLFPTYKSTDFEVHRNWLAITHNLPLSEWYWEDTSEWTLDYPPFFAYFEWFLSQFAALYDPEILTISAEPVCTPSTLIFQRTSVVVSDIILLVGVIMYCDSWPLKQSGLDIMNSDGKVFITSFIALANPGLLMIDHIHFQYNGFLMGILLISIACIRKGNDLGAALAFATLLMFKHIFFYCAPLFVVYLLRHYCFEPDFSQVEATSDRNSNGSPGSSPATAASSPEPMEERLIMARRFNFFKFIKLASVVLIVVACGLGPFLVFRGEGRSIVDVLQQMLSRLFPFGRGLVHAYWAPNVWALYYALDKGLVIGLRVASKIVPGGSAALPGLLARMAERLANASAEGASSATGGLVQVQAPDILPEISKSIPFMLTFMCMLPILADVWFKPHPKTFAPALIFCMMCSFMLGYHVHEKAILMIILPLSFVAAESAADSKLFILLSFVGHFSLFPLLFGSAEFPIKVLLVAAHSLLSYILLDSFQKYRRHPSTKGELWEKRIRRAPMGAIFIGRRTKTYMGCMALVFIFKNFVHPAYFVKTVVDDSTDPPTTHRETKFEFLPLMLMSVVCAGGLVVYWFRLYLQHRRKMEALMQYTVPLKPGTAHSKVGRSRRILMATDTE